MAKDKKSDMDYQKIVAGTTGLALEELVDLKSEIDKQIKQKQKSHQKELYKQMQDLALVAGFTSVEEFMSSNKGRSPRSDKGVKLPAKYRNPADSTKTWPGKGRKPGWVVSHLEGGGKLEDLEIK